MISLTHSTLYPQAPTPKRCCLRGRPKKQRSNTIKYLATVNGLSKVKDDLITLKKLFDWKTHSQTNLQPTLLSSSEDRAAALNLIKKSIAELNNCIKRIEKGGFLNSPLGDLDNKLSQELRKAAKRDTDMTNVSDFIVATYMAQLMVTPDIPTTDREERKNAIVAEGNRKSCIRPNPHIIQDLDSLGVTVTDMAEVKQILTGVDDWSLDIFTLDQVSNNRPLTFMAFTLFEKFNLLDIFKIRTSTLVTYMASVGDNYPDNPYHNRLHAADVTHSVSCLLQAPALEGVFSNLEILAVIFSAAIHDLGHPGVTNRYLINTNSDLALIYNDESILEHYHLSLAFELLQRDGADIFGELERWQRHSLMRMITDLVLATDNAKHTTVMSTMKLHVAAFKDKPNKDHIAINKRIELLKGAIHTADLTNPTKPLVHYQNWVNRIMEEFWRQGDLEREEGLPISPMCDRDNTNVCKAQMGFIDYVAKPMWSIWSDLVSPHANVMMSNMKDNRKFYARNDECENEANKLKLSSTFDKQGLGAKNIPNRKSKKKSIPKLTESEIY